MFYIKSSPLVNRHTDNGIFDICHNSLPDPPDSIADELESTRISSLDKTDIRVLDEVLNRDICIGILLGNANSEAEVVLYQLIPTEASSAETGLYLLDS